MGRKHCGKRRNCSLRQFLLFPQCFQKACFPGASKGVIVWEWVKQGRVENIAEKRGNTVDVPAYYHLPRLLSKAFFLFPKGHNFNTVQLESFSMVCAILL